MFLSYLDIPDKRIIQNKTCLTRGKRCGQFSFIVIFLLVALLTGYFITQYTPTIMLLGVLALVVFTISFINIEWGLHILIFSMLLSPEIMTGETTGSSLGRGVTLRLEDFLLAVIGLSWFARTAVKKELGLFLKTPLNKAILFYALACILSTGFGIMAGRVEMKTGALFVIKYIEYFIVFFMMVNHVRSTDQIKRFLICLFLTCFIASIIGMLQIPGGGGSAHLLKAKSENPIPLIFAFYRNRGGRLAGQNGKFKGKADSDRFNPLHHSAVFIHPVPNFLSGPYPGLNGVGVYDRPQAYYPKGAHNWIDGEPSLPAISSQK
ncbi:hypothetical protein ACFL2S_15390 [Thermodesulfobacteriota bacterium]